MSFDLICRNCGAHSSLATGICPFCKCPFTSSGSGNGGVSTFSAVRTEYDQGRLSQAVSLASDLAQLKPEVLDDAGFIILFSKILFETEGPEFKIKGLLSRGLLKSPQSPEIHDYLDLLEVKEHFDESQLQKIIRRSPDNAHALFLMGTHLYWNGGDPVQAAAYLEKCVRLRPVFLRAWACLGAIYKKLGNMPLAAAAFQKCVALEDDPKMKQFFQNQAR